MNVVMISMRMVLVSNVKLSKASLDKLASIKEPLRQVCMKAFETMPFDIQVLEGIRTVERQKELVAKGASKTMNSRHLTGDAVDLAPYPIDWKDLGRFKTMSEHMYAAANELGIKIKWGGEFNGFYDGPHFQLEK